MQSICRAATHVVTVVPQLLRTLFAVVSPLFRQHEKNIQALVEQTRPSAYSEPPRSMQTAGHCVAAGPEAGGLSPAMMMDDEYMLYTYKVRACDRKGAHSWTECPFTHPGEKAARRCPKSHIYSAEACPDARKSGKCARGDACPHSHGVFEQWLHPSRYRTQLCSFGAACRRPVCFFAHSVSELRLPTACGPPAAAAAAAAAQQAAAVAAAMAAARNTASLAPGPNSMEAFMQQALLAQMAAASPSQVDGATATLINRYQAASCAALANAAACQRQQQQHQAAAAAAAAAAVAAAASNPASLLGMAQAAQAYQAAAAAAAAAAANVPYGGYQQQAAQMQHQMGMPSSTSSAFGCGGSGASSPTCGSGMSRHSSSAYESAAAALFRSGSGGTDNNSVASAADLTAANNYLLQQALFAAAGGNSGASSNAPAPPLLPWLPSASGGMPAFGYPSSLLPATPAASDTSMGSGGTANGSRCSMSCGLDALAPHLQRQLSLSMFQ